MYFISFYTHTHTQNIDTSTISPWIALISILFCSGLFFFPSFAWNKSLHIPLSVCDNIEYETILAFFILFSMVVLDIIYLSLYFFSSFLSFSPALIHSQLQSRARWRCHYFPAKVIIQWPSPSSHAHACMHTQYIWYNVIMCSSIQYTFTFMHWDKSHLLLCAAFAFLCYCLFCKILLSMQKKKIMMNTFTM